MLRYHLKTQENITVSRQNLLFSLKLQKNNNCSSASDWWKNTKSSFKEKARTFLKILSLKKILEFQDWKKTANLYKKQNFRPEIKQMIENSQDELYQLENKQNVLNLVLILIRRMAKNTPKLSSKYLVHGIGAKFVLNWEQNMLYNKN